jgi:hypothetical protein
LYSVKANKSLKDWVVATYCDYGKENNKTVLRFSYSLKSSVGSWCKLRKPFSKNGYRCWQEDREGNILNDSKR